MLTLALQIEPTKEYIFRKYLARVVAYAKKSMEFKKAPAFFLLTDNGMYEKISKKH